MVATASLPAQAALLASSISAAFACESMGSQAGRHGTLIAAIDLLFAKTKIYGNTSVWSHFLMTQDVGAQSVLIVSLGAVVPSAMQTDAWFAKALYLLEYSPKKT